MLPVEQPRVWRRGVRALACASLVVGVATFVATEVDFVRRHRPGMAPEVYLRPQALQILAPGLAATAATAAAAAWVARRQRRGPNRRSSANA